MPYTPIRSGFTGPSARIGGSSDYHIDLKISEQLPIADQVKAFDNLARHYASLNRKIEFSNQGVSSQIYNPDAPLDDKVRLLNQAAAAHAPRIHKGWRSFDYYVPFKNENRFQKSAEGASIFIPGIAGGKVRRGTGGGYGFYSESLDPSGRVLFRVGHGDINRPEQGDVDVLGQAPPAPELPPPPGGTQTTASASGSSKDSGTSRKEQYMKAMMFQGLLSQMNQPSMTDQLLAQFMQSSPYQQAESLPFQNLLG
jgi:hypothetical protein